MSEVATGDTGTTQATQALVADAAAAVGNDQAHQPNSLSEAAPNASTEAVMEEEVIEKISIPLPMSLGVPEDDSPSKKWKVFLFSSNCQSCDALMPFLPDAEGTVDGSTAPCHFRLGNVHCPAGQLEFVRIGAKVKAANLLRAAMAAAKEDPMQMAEAIAKITKMIKTKKLSSDELSQVYAEVGLAV